MLLRVMCINTCIIVNAFTLGPLSYHWLQAAALPGAFLLFPWSLVTGGLSRPLRKGAGFTFGAAFPCAGSASGVCSSAVLKIALQAGTKLKSSFPSLLVGFLAGEQRELSDPQPCACPPGRGSWRGWDGVGCRLGPRREVQQWPLGRGCIQLVRSPQRLCLAEQCLPYLTARLCLLRWTHMESRLGSSSQVYSLLRVWTGKQIAEYTVVRTCFFFKSPLHSQFAVNWRLTWLLPFLLFFLQFPWIGFSLQS